MEEIEEYRKILGFGASIFEPETPKYSKYRALDHYFRVNQ
jgi:hypothetical protein